MITNRILKRIWGYARRSTNYEEQAESLERQARRITEYASKIDGKLIEIVAETESASLKSYKVRPGFAQLMGKMSKGDTLVVENIYRLERGNYLLAALMQELKERKITLVLLDPGPQALQLDEGYGAVLVHSLCISGALWMDQHRRGRRECSRIKRERNEPYTSFPPIGFKWGENEDGKSTWDEDYEAQDVIRELVRRYHGIWNGSGKCEKFIEIARDFYARNITIAGHRGKSNLGYVTNGRTRRPLVRRYKHTTAGTKGLDHSVMRRVYMKYVNELLDGSEFHVPIERFDELDPEHAKELRWLQKVFQEKWKGGFEQTEHPPAGM